jgi:hypothetical protein
MADSIPPFDGAADPNAWNFSANHGPLPNPVGHTFPLLSHNSEGHWRLIGTGFYISNDGLFVTAKHVIEDALNGDQQKADIALGVAAHATNKVTGETLLHWSWRLSWVTPTVGTKAGTYAFPNHAIRQVGERQMFVFRPDAYLGYIQEVADFRDRVMVSYPYIRADFRIHGGASGGPIFGSEGAVIGINCTELKPEGPGFGAQIRCLQDAFIDDAVLLGKQVSRRVMFTELVSAGVVDVVGFTMAAIDSQPGRLVRLDFVPITARGPDIETIMYS